MKTDFYSGHVGLCDTCLGFLFYFMGLHLSVGFWNCVGALFSWNLWGRTEYSIFSSPSFFFILFPNQVLNANPIIVSTFEVVLLPHYEANICLQEERCDRARRKTKWTIVRKRVTGKIRSYYLITNNDLKLEKRIIK